MRTKEISWLVSSQIQSRKGERSVCMLKPNIKSHWIMYSSPPLLLSSGSRPPSCLTLMAIIPPYWVLSIILASLQLSLYPLSRVSLPKSDHVSSLLKSLSCLPYFQVKSYTPNMAYKALWELDSAYWYRIVMTSIDWTLDYEYLFWVLYICYLIESSYLIFQFTLINSLVEKVLLWSPFCRWKRQRFPVAWHIRANKWGANFTCSVLFNLHHISVR